MFDIARKLENAQNVTQADAVLALADTIATLDNHNNTPVGLAIGKAFDVYVKDRKNNPNITRATIANGFAEWLNRAATDFENATNVLLSGKLDSHTIPADCELDFAITGKNISWATAYELSLVPNARSARKTFKLKCKEYGDMSYLLGTLNTTPTESTENVLVD